MTNKNKIIAAFLVSAGLFSANNAMQYVKELSHQQRAALCLVASADAETVDTSEPLRTPVEKNRQG